MLDECKLRKKYRFVMIRSPHELMHDPLVRDLFPKVVALKVEGYRQEYNPHVLPFDSSDFIATHLLLCEYQKDRSLLPVLGFKSITLERCDNHRIAFPMLGMMESDEAHTDYKSIIQQKLNHYRKMNLQSKIAYNGSFTILPRLREDKELMKALWDITFSLLTNYYIDYQIPYVMAVCATKFHVHLKKEKLGWNFIIGLEEYPSRALYDAGLIPMELINVKEKSQESAAKYKDMWVNRVTFEETREVMKKAG